MITVIADDLTGACECAALALRSGGTARVVIDGPAPDGVRLVAVNTDSRHVAPDEAARRVASRVPARGLVYKKTDSVLRGNITAELVALHQARPQAQLVYAPALPVAGRTVVDGRLLVHGVPVETTEFARDPLAPVRDGDVRRLLPGSSHVTLAQLRDGDLPRDPLLVVDGETDADLAMLARLCQGRDVVAAGPAGLLAHLVGSFAFRVSRFEPGGGRWLFVSGSQHPRTLEQIGRVVARGVPVATLDPAWIASDASPPALAVPGILRTAAIAEDVAHYRAAGIDPHRLTARLAEAAAVIARTTGCDLALCGGETALAVVRRLGIACLEPIHELAQGAVVCRAGDRLILTKNGGFGPPELLERLL